MIKEQKEVWTRSTQTTTISLNSKESLYTLAPQRLGITILIKRTGKLRTGSCSTTSWSINSAQMTSRPKQLEALKSWIVLKIRVKSQITGKSTKILICCFMKGINSMCTRAKMKRTWKSSRLILTQLPLWVLTRWQRKMRSTGDFNLILVWVLGIRV